jgi:hypothetical protein
MTERLARICEDLDVTFVDIAPALAADRGRALFEIDGHLRPHGHAIVAAALEQTIGATISGAAIHPATIGPPTDNSTTAE